MSTSESIKNYEIVSISLDRELLYDIYFDMMKNTDKLKEKGGIMHVPDPKSSLGKYLFQKLRTHVPNRNIQVVAKPSEAIVPERTDSYTDS